MTMTEKNGPEFPKQTALKRLCKEIGKHLVRGTVDNRNALGLETVLHKEITNVDVPGLLPAGCSTILFESDSALVILIKTFSGFSYPCLAKIILAQIVLGR
jgi:hypothetical protein